MEIKIKLLSSHNLKDFCNLIKVFENVFEMKNFQLPNQEYLLSVLSKEDFKVFVAMIDTKVIGGLTVYTLQQYYSTKPLAYIYDLAVKNEYQRQGIGKQLISFCNNYCKENNYEEVFIQADLEDDYAVDFYRSTGGQESSVVNFSYKLNETEP